MRTLVAWSESAPEQDGRKQTVWDIAFKPDGSLMVAAIGKRLVVFDPNDGTILKTKQAHGNDIYTVSCSRDGLYIASGASDKTVSVWTWELSQKYTYTHADSIQALAFNPVMHNVLASCSSVDFAIWTMPSSSLRKVRVASKILCAAWTSDGQYLAMGMLSGHVSIRDGTGAEKLVIERSAPVWDLAWNPSKDKDDATDILSLACWDGTLSFYQLSGEQIGKDKQLGCDPCSVKHFSNGDYLVVAGSDRKATLMTRDGIRLNTVAEAKDWVWRAVPRPKTNFVAVACNDGTISMHSIVFSTVHGLYQDRYAFRENMTDVVVQHLVTEQRARIKCREYVKKIAVYRDRLAVQLPDRIIIYELSGRAGEAGGAATAAKAEGSTAPGAPGAPEFDLRYRVRDKIIAQLECNLLVVTSFHVILCQERKLQLYDFAGRKARYVRPGSARGGGAELAPTPPLPLPYLSEWVLEAVIRYIKVVGGPPGREGLLVGLKNGTVLKIFVDNPFPITLIKHKSSIRCLDLSMSRRKLAVVDETAAVYVYDAVSQEPLYTEAGANSVAWNTEMEDMLCFSGNGVLSIKTGTFPLHTQKMQGFVVGFNGSKIFCLHSVAMQTIDVPQSASLYRYIEDKDWDMAYRVACLGVTDSDWRLLGESALRAMQMHVARAAYVRLQDMRYIELLNWIESQRKALAAALGRGGAGAPLGDAEAPLLAEVMAYAGRHGEAAKLHLKGGTVERAIEMFTDLRLWNEARKFAEDSGRVDVNALMLKQATWAEETGDSKAAATIYSAVGQTLRAVHILGERGLYNQLIELVRTLPSVGGAQRDGGSTARDDAAADDNGAAGADSSVASRGGGENGLPRDVREALGAAGNYFRSADLPKFARECFVKLGDSRAMVQLHVDAQQWPEALSLAHGIESEALARAAAHPVPGGAGLSKAARFAALPAAVQRDVAAAKALVAHTHLTHAEWLAVNDRYEEAQHEFEIGGRPDLSMLILEQLAVNAVEGARFGDAAFFYTRLAQDSFDSANGLAAVSASPAAKQRSSAATAASDAAVARLAAKHRAYTSLADLYAAYALVHEFTRAPFTSATPDAIFHAARFVLNQAIGATGMAGSGRSAGGARADDLEAALRTGRGAPTLVSAASQAPPRPQSPALLPYKLSPMQLLYAIARQAQALSAFKLARFALDRLNGLLIPAAWRDAVELSILRVQSKPFSDRDDLVPVCYRCGAANPMLTVTPNALACPPAPRPRTLHGAVRAAKAAATANGRAPAVAGAAEADDATAVAGSVIATLGTDDVPPPHFTGGDACTNCGCAFVRSFIGFDPLPLVEFVPEDRVSLDEAIAFLMAEPAGTGSGAGGGGGGSNWPESSAGGIQSLSFGGRKAPQAGSGGGGEDSSRSGDELFNDLLSADNSVPGEPVRVPAVVLKALRPSDVFIVRPGSRRNVQADGGGSAVDSFSVMSGPVQPAEAVIRPRFFKNVIPDIAIATCASCNRFFLQEDFEFEVLKRGGCPVCRAAASAVGL